MNEPQMQRPISRGRVLEFPHFEERSPFEDSVKARLQVVTNLVEGFTNSAINLLRIEKTSSRKAVEELIVKEAALRWIVRVAAHSNGPIRETLWADIDNAVTDLEKIAELVMHAEIETSAFPLSFRVFEGVYVHGLRTVGK